VVGAAQRGGQHGETDRDLGAGVGGV
jgi:hypothetical protein